MCDARVGIVGNAVIGGQSSSLSGVVPCKGAVGGGDGSGSAGGPARGLRKAVRSGGGTFRVCKDGADVEDGILLRADDGLEGA